MLLTVTTTMEMLRITMEMKVAVSYTHLTLPTSGRV